MSQAIAAFETRIIPCENTEAEQQARIEAMTDTYYSFDDDAYPFNAREEEELRDFEDVYGVSGHLFVATTLHRNHVEEA